MVKKFGHLHLVYHFTVPLNKNIGFLGMWTLPDPLSEKLNFIFVINFKKTFSGGQKQKNCILTLNFIYSGQLEIIKKNHVEHFFQFLMFNISSIKELLHKPSEIQWNINGTLPRKLKRKIYLALSYKILPLEITRTWEIAILGGTLGDLGTNVEFNGFAMILWISGSFSLYFWLKTV